MANAALEVVNVSKTFKIPHEQRTTFREYALHPFRGTSFEQNEALKDVSLTIEKGEFFGVIGANGSGKSTLLKIMAGIYVPSSGRVRVHGKLSPFIELGVGFNPDLTGRENVRVNATLLGLTKKELNARFEEIVAFAELERFMDLKLKDYSTGMSLRLGYSIAIHVPFEVLLLDEVLAVGDREFARKCFATFDRFKEERQTMVFVSHDLGAVEKWCDRVAYLEGGRVETVGSAEDVCGLYRERTGGAAQLDAQQESLAAAAG
jgi:ABC-type polysaccharide/polyol phosphate transport system ATPase subunit